MNKEAPLPTTKIGIKFSGGDFEGTQNSQHSIRKAGEREEDEESILSNVEHQEGDLNNLDISDYCISSDAETEKMSDDKIQQGIDNLRPHISDLVVDFASQEQTDKKRGKEEEADDIPEQKKKTKLEGRVYNGSEFQHDESDTISVEQRKNCGVNIISDGTNNSGGNNGEGEGEGDGNNNVNNGTERVIPKQLSQLEQFEEPGAAFKMDEVTKDQIADHIKEKHVVEEDHIEDEKGEVEEDQAEEEEGEVEEDQVEEEEGEVEEDQVEEEEEMDQVEEEEEEVEDDQIEEDEDEEEPEKKQTTATGEDNNNTLEKDHQENKPMSPMPSPIEIEQLRLNALKEITEIEYKFVELRQKLYDNKLQRLQTELQMCREGSHPDLQSYYQKIASIRDYKLRRAYQRQKYELKCIDKETRATRTFIHQDFIRHVSDIRNQLLNETTQEWYDINKERRDMDIFVPEVNYHVPIKIAGKTLSCITGYAGPAQQRYPGEPLTEDLECENIRFRYRSNAVDKLEVIVDRMRLNNELSDLEGLKKFFNGFPGAPELNGLRDSEVFDDLQELPLQRQ